MGKGVTNIQTYSKVTVPEKILAKYQGSPLHPQLVKFKRMPTRCDSSHLSCSAPNPTVLEGLATLGKVFP